MIFICWGLRTVWILNELTQFLTPSSSQSINRTYHVVIPSDVQVSSSSSFLFTDHPPPTRTQLLHCWDLEFVWFFMVCGLLLQAIVRRKYHFNGWPNFFDYSWSIISLLHLPPQPHSAQKYKSKDKWIAERESSINQLHILFDRDREEAFLLLLDLIEILISYLANNNITLGQRNLTSQVQLSCNAPKAGLKQSKPILCGNI